MHAGTAAEVPEPPSHQRLMIRMPQSASKTRESFHVLITDDSRETIAHRRKQEKRDATVDVKEQEVLSTREVTVDQRKKQELLAISTDASTKVQSKRRWRLRVPRLIKLTRRNEPTGSAGIKHETGDRKCDAEDEGGKEANSQKSHDNRQEGHKGDMKGGKDEGEQSEEKRRNEGQISLAEGKHGGEREGGRGTGGEKTDDGARIGTGGEGRGCAEGEGGGAEREIKREGARERFRAAGEEGKRGAKGKRGGKSKTKHSLTVPDEHGYASQHKVRSMPALHCINEGKDNASDNGGNSPSKRQKTFLSLPAATRHAFTTTANLNDIELSHLAHTQQASNSLAHASFR
jgi:hypothetical protein